MSSNGKVKTLAGKEFMVAKSWRNALLPQSYCKAPHQAHSFHSYFLRPGIMEESILFDVDRIRNGKSFTTRRVRAIQNGEAIFACSISFKKKKKDLSIKLI